MNIIILDFDLSMIVGIMKYSDRSEIEDNLKRYWSKYSRIVDVNLHGNPREYVKKSTQWLNNLDESGFKNVVFNIAHIGMIIVVDNSPSNRTKALASLKNILDKFGKKTELHSDDVEVIKYITGLTIKTITDKENEGFSSFSIKLPKNIKDSVENSLTEFAVKPYHGDEKLIHLAETYLGHILTGPQPKVFERLRRRVMLLIELLLEEETDIEAKQWTRAGLSYFVERHDKIEDDLGYAGLFDDAYAIQTALELSMGQPSTLGYLADSILRRYPILREVTVHSTEETKIEDLKPISEYILANLSLVDQIHSNNQSFSIALPISRNVPILVGWLFTLMKCREHIKPLDKDAFQIGDTILFDHRYPAEYLGLYKNKFKLKVYPIKKNHYALTISYNVTEIDRLSLTNKIDRPTGNKGNLPPSKHRASILVSALETLFRTPFQPNFREDMPQVIVISMIGHSTDFLESYELFGQKLSNVIPIHKIDCNGCTIPVADYWADFRPQLLLTSRAEYANLYMDSHEDHTVELVLADSAGIESHPEMELAYVDCPKLLFFRRHEISLGKRLMDNKEFCHIEWSKQDISTLPGDKDDKRNSKLLLNGEKRLRRMGSSEINFHILPSEILNSACKACDNLLHTKEKYGDNPPADYCAALTYSYALIKKLLSTYVPLRMLPVKSEKIVEFLSKIEDAAESSYIERTDREAFGKIHDLLVSSVCELEQNNAKLEKIRELLQHMPDITIACGTRDIIYQLEQYSDLASTNLLLLEKALGDDELDNSNMLILPATSRGLDANILLHSLEFPAASCLHIIQYELDHYRLIKWTKQQYAYEIFKRISSDVRSEISDCLGSLEDNPERNLFDEFGLKVGIQELFTSPEGLDAESDIKDEKEIMHLQTAFFEQTNEKQPRRINRAWRVWFTDGSIAYMSNSTKLNVIKDAPDESAATALKPLLRENIQLGDRVIFRSDSNSDAVRERADKILDSQGIRQTGSIWISALVRFAESFSDLDSAANEIRMQLEKLDVFRTVTTISSWIHGETMFPQQRNAVLSAILEITQDEILAEHMKVCEKALRTIQSAHLKAGKELAAEIYLSLKERIACGIGITESIELEDMLCLVEVDEIEKVDVEIDTTRIGIRLGVFI